MAEAHCRRIVLRRVDSAHEAFGDLVTSCAIDCGVRKHTLIIAEEEDREACDQIDRNQQRLRMKLADDAVLLEELRDEVDHFVGVQLTEITILLSTQNRHFSDDGARAFISALAFVPLHSQADP